VLAVYIITDGVVGCKVGFLGQHLAKIRADNYDGLTLMIIKIYTERCNNIVKCNKMHQNGGCCVGAILGDCKCLRF
jgi:hypothetical protein